MATDTQRTHGGWLDATSTPGGGTVFRLELPRTTSGGGEAATEGEIRMPTLDALRVLVVDDHDDIVQVATLVVETAGGVAFGARDADEARDLLAAEEVDVVVTDLVMPGTTGRKLLDALESEHPTLPVVAMSGVPEQGAHAAQRPNVKAALDKPFTSDRLLDAILLAAGRT